MSKADNLQEFRGGNDAQRAHLNAMIEAIKENAKELNGLKKGNINVMLIQDTRLAEFSLKGKLIRYVTI